VPIYEYRCPNGHVFELFKRMDDPAPESCEVCDASPVELVLYPVAIHYKGSGFYSTDYGKGSKRKGDGGTSDKSETKSDSSSSSPSTETKKAAEA
jgi:putative FmdB family regulatory protein